MSDLRLLLQNAEPIEFVAIILASSPTSTKLMLWNVEVTFCRHGVRSANVCRTHVSLRLCHARFHILRVPSSIVPAIL